MASAGPTGPGLARCEDYGVPETLNQAITSTTVPVPGARGSLRWTAPGPDGS